jgi:polar amino acid transport system permease protein
MGISQSQKDQQSRTTLEIVIDESRSRVTSSYFLYSFPWWALALVLLGIFIAISIAADEIYSRIFDQLKDGVAMTLRVAVISYLCAFGVGLVVGMIRSTPPRPRSGMMGRILSLAHLALYNAATFFVMVMRGLPVLIVLLIFAFVVVPAVRNYLADNLGIELAIRGSSVESAIIALAFTYGAFLSETFRAGIQSIGKGQVEAARSLGMNYWQTMRYIVLPQAIRRVLPPLGNDFVAIVKDSSLVAILGIRDLTQLAKVSSGASFRYLETYLTVAFIYLSMTIIGAVIVRYIERRFSVDNA